MTKKLNGLRLQIRRNRHTPLPEQHAWLTRVLRGHDEYYGLPGNSRALSSFHREVQRSWCRALQRRGGLKRLTWADFHDILERHPLPLPRITHTHESLRARFKSDSGRAECGKAARSDL